MSDILLSPLSLVSISFAFGLLLTMWVRRFLIKRSLLDHPNERSSHTVPVPRGGGWAVLGVLIPGLLITGLFQHGLPDHITILAAVLVLAFVSWYDDRKGASVMMRLSMHIFAACLGSAAFASNETIFGGALPFWTDRALMILGWAWFMNLYNFMDGIDGITCVETISLAIGTCLVMVMTRTHDPFVFTLTLLLTGACLGFLVLNWHPAKIFLGDVGSVPLGFLTGYILLFLAVRGHIAAALLLPLYYIADSGITITKRALRREKIWQSHRQHFYQRAAQGLGQHHKVVYLIMETNIALIIAALLTFTYPCFGGGLGVLAVAFLLWKLHKTS